MTGLQLTVANNEHHWNYDHLHVFGFFGTTEIPLKMIYRSANIKGLEFSGLHKFSTSCNVDVFSSNPIIAFNVEYAYSDDRDPTLPDNSASIVAYTLSERPALKLLRPFLEQIEFVSDKPHKSDVEILESNITSFVKSTYNFALDAAHESKRPLEKVFGELCYRVFLRDSYDYSVNESIRAASNKFNPKNKKTA